jgi:hypothetical protein
MGVCFSGKQKGDWTCINMETCVQNPFIGLQMRPGASPG